MTQDVNIHPDTIVSRNEEKYIANQLGDEMVMMNNDTGNFLSVNRVAADIWNLLENPLPTSALIDKLAELYDIPYEQCKTETLAFLSESNKHEVFIFS